MTNNQDPGDYFFRKSSKKTYLSKKIEPTQYPEDSIRFVNRIFDNQELHEYIEEKGELILEVTPNERVELVAIVLENNRKLRRLVFQRFERRSGKPHKKTAISLNIEALDKLFDFLRTFEVIPLDDPRTRQFNNEYLEKLLLDDEIKLAFFRENSDLLTQFIQSGIAERDIVALGYRKKQLKIFDGLLHDPQFLEACRHNWDIKKPGKEAIWQHFFENNKWIFGYGLNYVFNAPLDGRKLEQIIAGTTFNQAGKRTDGLLKTKGVIGSLCFVEIKTHETQLLDTREYRDDCWPISAELAGAVSQIQRTVQKAIREIKTKVEMTTPDDEPTGEVVFLYQPKSYVVIGSLEQFIAPHGIREQKFSSFELFRRNITNPEIITFDELYERAKFIVFDSEKDAGQTRT